MPTAFQTMEAELLFPLIPESGSFAVDVGANEGYWSRELAGRFDTVHAIEPQAGITNVPGNVHVLNAALGEYSGTAIVRLYGNSEHATMVDRPDVGYGRQRGTIAVPLLTLDELYLGNPVDFIKIDVEGAEVAVIRGGRRLLKRARPQLLVEIHSREAHVQVLAILLELGYTANVIPNPTPGADDYCWIHAR